MNIALLTGRGGAGSSFPGKNVFPILGRPLMLYPYASAKKSRLIDDIVDAFMLALRTEESKRQTYNLGTGITYTVRQVLDLLIESYGYKPAEYPVLKIEDHAGDIFGTRADSTKFRRQCGWEPKVQLADGIGRMVAWLREGVRR